MEEEIGSLVDSLLENSSSEDDDIEKGRTPVFIVVSIISLVLYAILSSVCVYSFVKTFYKKESKILSRIFHIFCFMYTTIRIIWYLKRVIDGSGAITFFLNNISFPIYITALLVVFFFWYERYNSTYVSSNEFLPKFKLSFIFLNVTIYITQIILILLFYTISNQKKEGGLIYLLNTLFQSCISLLIGLSFLFIVFRIYFTFTSIDKDVCRNQISQVRKICLLSVAFSICFIIRAIIFFYNPITHKFLNYEVFMTFGYFIPDCVPILIQISIIHSNMKTEQEDSSFINMLYENEIDDYNQGDDEEDSNNLGGNGNNSFTNKGILIGNGPNSSSTTASIGNSYYNTTTTFGDSTDSVITLSTPQKTVSPSFSVYDNEASYLLK